ncbi:MAG TPA: HEAT repeat domain-containing protein [Thermoanaerobaculia bacterium]
MTEDLPKESPRTILFQFVIFPLGIVLIGVGVFLLFGLLASEKSSVPDYLNAIRSGSAHERGHAAYQLSRSINRGETKKYPNLEQQVASIYTQSKNDDPQIRRYLALVLGKLGDRRATPTLLEGLRDNDAESRLYAIVALGQLHDPAAVPSLIAATRDDDKDVRKTAAFSLGEIGDPRAADALAPMLEDQVADVRFNAAIALSRFGDKRAIGTLHDMLDRQRLGAAKMREDQAEDAMIVAMEPYAKLAGHDAVADLQKLATTDPSLRIRDAAKQALQQVH